MKELRTAYDRAANEREQNVLLPWKLEERARFLAWLQAEGKGRLLEIGAGTGKDSSFFLTEGLNVISTDLSYENAEYCRRKGLEACEMDFFRLGFKDRCFDSVYAMNCLLHVPKSEMRRALEEVYRVLRGKGLFYLGQYGGQEFEGILLDDHYEPKRYYSLLTDEQMKAETSRYFQIEYFGKVEVNRQDETEFQSLILRRT